MDHEAMAKNKRRMLGNIKFFGELFKLKVSYPFLCMATIGFRRLLN